MRISAANQRGSHGALVSKVFICGQPLEDGDLLWLILAILCLAPFPHPKVKLIQGVPGSQAYTNRHSPQVDLLTWAQTDGRWLKDSGSQKWSYKEGYSKESEIICRELVQVYFSLEWAGFEQPGPDELNFYCATSNLKFLGGQCHRLITKLNTSEWRFRFCACHLYSQFFSLSFFFNCKPSSFPSRQPFLLGLLCLSEIIVALFFISALFCHHP